MIGSWRRNKGFFYWCHYNFWSSDICHYNSPIPNDAITIRLNPQTCHFLRLRRPWAHKQTSVLSYRPKYPCCNPLSPLTDIRTPHVIPFPHPFFSFLCSSSSPRRRLHLPPGAASPRPQPPRRR